MSGHVSAVLGRLGRTQIRYVDSVSPSRADPYVARIYRQVDRDFGVLAPPVILHAPARGALAASWMLVREILVVPGPAGRAAKEAVAAAVSEANACPFCVTIHQAALDVLGDSTATGPLVDWFAAETGVPPFPAAWLPELIGTAVGLHYLNRMVNIFLGERPLPPGVPARALGPVLRVLRRLIRRAATGPHEPGQSLALLPPAALPADLGWAASSPNVADAVSRAAAAFELAGTRSVPPRVRELLAAELADWAGDKRGPSRAWVEDLVVRLPPVERAAGRLVLLTAFASYQIERSVVDDCGLDDRALVELTSWAGMAAARRIGERLWLAARQSRAASEPN